MTWMTGSDISITIDSIDYSIYINNIKESGGANKFVSKKMLGNNYKLINIGKEDYALELSFISENDKAEVLYANALPQTIIVTDGTQTITYNNMYVTNLIYNHDVEGITMIILTYIAVAYDSSISAYNRVIS